MNIQKISIEKLKPAEYNPRKDLKPEDEEYQKIKKSLVEFGYVVAEAGLEPTYYSSCVLAALPIKLFCNIIKIVEDLVKTLKKYNQDIIDMRYYQMLSIEEIAVVLCWF